MKKRLTPDEGSKVFIECEHCKKTLCITVPDDYKKSTSIINCTNCQVGIDVALNLRKSPRKSVNVMGTLYIDKKRQSVIVSDISLTGVLLTSSSRLIQKGNVYEIEYSLPTNSGVVIREKVKIVRIEKIKTGIFYGCKTLNIEEYSTAYKAKGFYIRDVHMELEK